MRVPGSTRVLEDDPDDVALVVRVEHLGVTLGLIGVLQRTHLEQAKGIGTLMTSLEVRWRGICRELTGTSSVESGRFLFRYALPGEESVLRRCTYPYSEELALSRIVY